MNRIEVGVLTPEAALRACADAWRSAEAGDGATPRLAFGSLHELFATLTEERLELLRQVASQPRVEAKLLSASLGRDYPRVLDDITDLVDLGLLERAADGALTAPYDEIVIHAEIRAAA